MGDGQRTVVRCDSCMRVFPVPVGADVVREGRGVRCGYCESGRVRLLDEAEAAQLPPEDAARRET